MDQQSERNNKTGKEPEDSASIRYIDDGCNSQMINQFQSQTLTPCFYSNSLAIRQEIHRFESVHPSIYAIYDLLDLIGGADGQLIAQRIREHVVCIEGM